jgi:hypothetical protein
MKKTIFIKKILLLLIMLPIASNIQSQTICITNIEPLNPISSDKIKIINAIMFVFGAGETCPSILGYSLAINETVLQLNLYYDISGYWPQLGCTSIDTTEIGKLDAGNYLMYINLNTIFYSDTNFIEDTDTLVFTVINSNDVYESEVDNKLVIYPNPAGKYMVFEFELQGSKCEFGNIQITDIFGRKVVELPLKSEKTVWDCREIENGVYFYISKIEGEKYSGKVVINKQSK